jgi:hypothetical protein
LALLPIVLRKFAGSGGTLVLARGASTGVVAARLNIAKRTPTEQRAKASKTRALKKPDCESGFFLMLVFRLDCLRRPLKQYCDSGSLLIKMAA